jgi:hypothetical protein
MRLGGLIRRGIFVVYLGVVLLGLAYVIAIGLAHR